MSGWQIFVVICFHHVQNSDYELHSHFFSNFNLCTALPWEPVWALPNMCWFEVWTSPRIRSQKHAWPECMKWKSEMRIDEVKICKREWYSSLFSLFHCFKTIIPIECWLGRRRGGRLEPMVARSITGIIVSGMIFLQGKRKVPAWPQAARESLNSSESDWQELTRADNANPALKNVSTFLTSPNSPNQSE